MSAVCKTHFSPNIFLPKFSKNIFLPTPSSLRNTMETPDFNPGC